MPGGTNIDAVSAAELAALDGITGNIQQQLDLKSPSNSPNFSGMPRSPTFAFGTSGNLIATVEYVNQAMFQTVLPSQLGRLDGDVLTTNGMGVASWRTPQNPNGRIYFTGSF